MYLLLLVQALVDKCRHHTKPGELCRKVLDSLGAGDEVQKQDALLWHPARLEHLDGHDGRTASGKHGIQEQHPALSNVLGELVVEELWLRRLLVSLDQDLADPDGTTAVPQALLHGLASPHDGHAADLALEHEAGIGAAHGSGDGVLDRGEVVQPFFDEQPDDTVRVEYEITPLRLHIANLAAQVSAKEVTP